MFGKKHTDHKLTSLVAKMVCNEIRKDDLDRGFVLTQDTAKRSSTVERDTLAHMTPAQRMAHLRNLSNS